MPLNVFLVIVHVSTHCEYGGIKDIIRQTLVYVSTHCEHGGIKDIIRQTLDHDVEIRIHMQMVDSKFHIHDPKRHKPHRDVYGEIHYTCTLKTME